MEDSSPGSEPASGPLLTVRAAVVLLIAILLGIIAGALGYLAHRAGAIRRVPPVARRPRPAGVRSQNPVGYCELPEEKPFLYRPCACGQDTDRDFLPGHDVRAIQARVREHFDGSPLKFVQWV